MPSKNTAILRNEGFLVILLLWGMVSCGYDTTCVETMQAPVNIGFYHYSGGGEQDTSFSGFTVNGINSDSLFYDSVNNLSEIALQLSPRDSVSGFLFIFSIPDTSYLLDTIRVFGELDTIGWDSVIKVPEVSYYPLIDTVYFTYDKYLNLVSDECGFLYFFTLKQAAYSKHVINSIRIMNPDISNLDEENVKILF